MPKVETVPTVRIMGEVAWLASRVGRQMIDAGVEPDPSHLKAFWQTTRMMQRSWLNALDNLTITTVADISQLEEIAAQVFTTEMPIRVWATILAGIDLKNGKDDLSRIARNAVNGVFQVRHQVASKMLSLAVDEVSRATELDRLRRRCDRWTDLLIGNMIGSDSILEFAFDPDRAHDFAQETLDYDPCTGPNPAEHLVTAGLRIGFLCRLPNVELSSPFFSGMIQSMLASLPATAFGPEGSLISEERHSTSMSAAEESSATDNQEVLLPGMTLAKMRRRFESGHDNNR